MSRYNVENKVTSKVQKSSFTGRNGGTLCDKGDRLRVVEILGSNYTVVNTKNKTKWIPFFIKDAEVE